jgi:methylated-DNA-protein-cysteine methyltransferase-like protein
MPPGPRQPTPSRRAEGPAAGAGRSSFDDDVAAVLDRLVPGDVVTYGEVAAEAGHPGAARAVGRYLARHGGAHAWWRVVTASGRLAPGKEADQARRLRAEGVAVDGAGRRVRPA